MKLQYLGTAAAEGWPALFCRCPACLEATRRGGRNLRTRSQAILDDRILFDFPAETYMHMLVHGVDLPNIKTCLITHTHSDHFYPQDMITRSEANAANMDDIPFTVYGNDSVVRRMEDTISQRANAEDLRRRIHWQELNAFETVEIEGYHVTALLALHNPKERCYIYLVERDGKRLFYGHDTGMLPEETWDFIAGKRLDMVSLDCTSLNWQRGNRHMGISDCLAIRDRMTRLGCADERTVFTINHFSHHNGNNPDGSLLLMEELEPYMAEKGFQVSYDGKVIEF